MKLLLTSKGLSTNTIQQTFKSLLIKPVEDNKVLVILMDASSEIVKRIIKEDPKKLATKLRNKHQLL